MAKAMLDKSSFNRGLLDFIQRSPTPFHAVYCISAALMEAGYTHLREEDAWNLKPGGRYFLTRNDSSIVAFHLANRSITQSGWRMVGAHTDSPCLKLKPNTLFKQHHYWQLGVEIYGGALLSPWFDRDLSLAGRITFLDSTGKVANALIDFEKPIAVVPSLAIHLDRDVNNSRSINAQTHMSPIVALLEGDEHLNIDALLLEQLHRQTPDTNAEGVLDFELSLYDSQPPAIVGMRDEFIAAARLDNLLSCYVGLCALLQADGSQHSVLVCNDHEEVGSVSAIGAQGPMLNAVLERLVPNIAERQQALARTMMISADNAHAVHPNFADKHDKQHGPRLNGGPVIKVNANQRYATNSESAAQFKLLCQRAQIPVQSFVSRADMACGSTIGPITASNIGIQTIDVGVPTFAMHSVRELAGSDDAFLLYQALLQFHALDQARI